MKRLVEGLTFKQFFRKLSTYDGRAVVVLLRVFERPAAPPLPEQQLLTKTVI